MVAVEFFFESLLVLEEAVVAAVLVDGKSSALSASPVTWSGWSLPRWSRTFFVNVAMVGSGGRGGPTFGGRFCRGRSILIGPSHFNQAGICVVKSRAWPGRTFDFPTLATSIRTWLDNLIDLVPVKLT